MISRRPHHVVPVPIGELVAPGIELTGASDVPLSGVGLDSRTACAGDLYAALPGAHVHGARFVAGAVENGAVAVLTDPAGLEIMRESGAPAVPVLVTDEPRAVLGEISAHVYGRPAEKIHAVGITGTNGKTTTAYLVDGALRNLGLTTGLVGTVETRIGEARAKSARTTPESCDLHALLAVMVEAGATALTMEVSSHALVLHRVDGVVYDVACFTNLSQDHLDFHHTMEEYAAAKASLFTPERARQGVIVVDDDWGRRIADEARIPVTTLANSADRGADWVIEAEHGARGFELVRGDGSARLSLSSPLPGDFNRTNTATAALALLALGHDDAAVERALAGRITVPGRAEVVDLGEGAPQVVVDFAHTPDAVSAVLAALRAGVTGPLVAVLGAGGNRDAGKRPHMGRAAALGADVVVVTDDNPRHEDPALIRAAVLTGATDALEAGEARARHALEVAGRSAAVARALELAGPDGLVAVLGKGHESGQQIGDEVHPYDDRSATVQAWEQVRTQAQAGTPWPTNALTDPARGEEQA